MPTALLIGFEYKINTLTGAVVDLYHSSTWCRSFGCDVNILTDIDEIRDKESIMQAVSQGIADDGIFKFCDSITDRCGGKSEGKIRGSETLLTSVEDILGRGVPDNKLIIYYSGHGAKDSMVMPDRTLLPFIDFRNSILGVLDPYVEIFCILDCCNPGGLHLPYKLNNNAFVLSPTKIECITQPMILITSSEVSEKSIATKMGSVFSLHLFRILTKLGSKWDFDWEDIRTSGKIVIPTCKNRNLRRLIGTLSSTIRSMHTGYSQTVSMYSSYVIDPILWMWVGQKNQYDLVPDITLSTLIIRDNKSREQDPACDV